MAQPYFKDSSVQDLDKLLSQAKGPHSRFESTWYLNLSYYQGNQWVYWNRGRLDRPRLAPSRVQITDNRIIGIVRTELAKMTKAKPAWQVVPTTGDDSDLQSSLTGEKVLDYLWRQLHMRNRLVDALLWSRICGAGFWKVCWDSAKGDKVTILADQEGQPVIHGETGAPMRPGDMQMPEGELPEGAQPKTIATGEVMVEAVSPFEFFPDPIATEIEDAEWCIQVAVKSPEYVHQHFGVWMEPDTDVAPGPTEARMMPTFEPGGSSGYRGVKLMEYWCKQTSQHENGRRAVWAKGKMLYEGSNPYGCLPYVMFKGIPVTGRFWPTSVVEQLRGPQTELNKIRSQIVENAQKIGNPALLASRQAKIEYSGVPGERVDFDDTVPNALPSYLEPPQMPQYVLQQQDRIEQSMQEISGQHEVSNAQVPAGVKAASAINLLQEADDTRLGPAIYDMEETLGIAGSMLLELVAKYWSDERTIMIAGEDHAWDVMMFKGAALKGNTHVEVQAGSAFPKSKAAKQAAIQDILNLMMQYSVAPMNPRLLRKVFKDYETGGLERLFTDLEKDEGQINRENGQLAQGMVFPTNPWDNNQMHIEGHTDFQKEASYKLLPPPMQQAFEMHIAEHRERLLAEMGPPPEAGSPAGEPPEPPQQELQMQQGQEQHEQKMGQSEELHQQKMKQMRQSNGAKTGAK